MVSIRRENIGFVVIDGLMFCLPDSYELSSGKEESFNITVAQHAGWLVDYLNNIARDTGCTILIVHHENKGKTGW